jgi:hypothetical protein
MEPNTFANPDDPNNPFGKYQYSFEDSFRASAAILRELLYEATLPECPLAEELERLAESMIRAAIYRILGGSRQT